MPFEAPNTFLNLIFRPPLRIILIRKRKKVIHEMNEHELEFAVFCVETLTSYLSIDAAKVYNALSVQSNILDQYTIPNYEVLHSQGKDYIVSDLIAVLLQKKYARVISCFSSLSGLSLRESMDVFYRSEIYHLMSKGISDMHCMSDEYLAAELLDEHQHSSNK